MCQARFVTCVLLVISFLACNRPSEIKEMGADSERKPAASWREYEEKEVQEAIESNQNVIVVVPPPWTVHQQIQRQAIDSENVSDMLQRFAFRKFFAGYTDSGMPNKETEKLLESLSLEHPQYNVVMYLSDGRQEIIPTHRSSEEEMFRAIDGVLKNHWRH